MKKVAVYPYNKITHGLIRFRDLLEFEIKHVIDFTSFNGEDACIKVDGSISGIKITDSIEDGLNGVDTLILNDAGSPWINLQEFYGKYNLQEKWKELVLKACEKGIKVISTHEIFDTGVREWLKENNVPLITFFRTREEVTKFVEQYGVEEMENKAKRIAVYGTRSCLGKFTTQLTLLRELKRDGKKVTALITEPTSVLFGQPDLEPFRLGMISSSIEDVPPYMDATLKKAEKEGNEYILFADQGYLVAKDCLGTILYKISMLRSFNPHMTILVVGYNDDENIAECINLLKIYGNGIPIAFVLPDKIEIEHGKYEIKSPEEIEIRKNELKEKFGVQYVEMINDIEKIKNAIKG